MGNAALFNGNYVKLLKDQLKLFNAARILTGTDDPTSVAKEAETGSLYLRQQSLVTTPAAWSYGMPSTGSFINCCMPVVGSTTDVYLGGGSAFFYKWDGSTISTIAGFDGGVVDIAAYGSDMFLVGYFTNVPGLTVGKVVRFTPATSTYQSLTGLAPNGNLLSCCVYGNSLYVSGGFTTVGGVSATNIAKYDIISGVWSALGSGLSSFARQLFMVGSDLYAVGSFASAGGVANTSQIAKYDTVAGTWSSVTGIAPNGTTIYGIVSAGSDLYVVGDFTTINGVSANYIAKYSGGVWSALGSGLGAVGRDLYYESSSNTLYVVGAFTTAGGIGARRVAKYNTVTTAWSVFLTGTEFDDDVYDIGYDAPNNRLLFSGNFLSANGNTAYGRFAVYKNATSTSTPTKLYTKLDDGTTTNWREISSTDALSVQKVVAGVATINGGSVLMPDNRVLMSWDGSGAAPTDFETQLTVTLSSLYSPANPTGHLYIDLSTIAVSPTQITGTSEYVYPITASNFAMNATTPENVDGSRYVYIGSFVSSGGVWSASNWYNAPKRVQTSPLKFVSPIIYQSPPTVVGSVGSANQISQAHVLDIDSFPSTLTNTSWWSLAANLSDGNTVGARNLSGTVSSYAAPGLFGTDTAANLVSTMLSRSDTFFRPATNTTPFVCGGWFKYANWIPAGIAQLFRVSNSGVDNSWEIQVVSTGSINLNISNSSVTAYDQVITAASPNFANNSWHHIAIAFSGTEAGIYLDGRLAKSAICSAVRIPTTGNFVVGSSSTSESVREMMYSSGTVYTDEDIRKLASYRITHNKNTAYINQNWLAGRVRADGDVVEEMGDEGWMVDKTNVNRLFVDFSDINPLDSVYLKLLDETGQAVTVLPTKTFDSGWMQAQPTGNMVHGLPDVPAAVVIQYEAVTGEYTTLAPNDYMSWDGTNLKPDLAAFGLLTISATHKWRVIASLGANAIGLAAASLTQAGVVSITDQHFNGNKWLNGNFSPEVDNTFDLGTTLLRWKTVHVGPGSLVVHYDTTDTKKLTIDFDSTMARFMTDATTPMEWHIGANQVGLIGTNGAWTIGPVGGGVTHTIYGALQVAGGFYLKYDQVSGTTVLADASCYVSATGSSQYSVTLPTAVGNLGRIIIIKSNMNAGILLTINTTSSQTIDGVLSVVISRLSSLQVISNGANWEVF